LQKSKLQKFSAACTTGAEAATATVLGAAAPEATQAAFLQYLPEYRIQPLLLPTHRRVQADDAERACDYLGGRPRTQLRRTHDPTQMVREASSRSCCVECTYRVSTRRSRLHSLVRGALRCFCVNVVQK
jgi:hypothetical protein